MSVPGIGPIISSAMVAAIGTGDAFAKGRDFAAWFLFMPRDHPRLVRLGEGRHDRRGAFVCGQQLNARRRQLLRGMLWPASARCNGASGSACARRRARSACRGQRL